MARRKKTSKKRAPKMGLWRRVWRALRWPLLLATLALAAWTLWLDYQVRSKFEGRKWALPARVYAAPLELYQGLRLSPQELEIELKQLGYRPVERLQGAGQFSRSAGRYGIYSRGFAFSDGREPSLKFFLNIERGYITELERADGELLPLVRLEPVEIGGIYPAHKEDRLLVRLEDIPPLLGESLIAVEDRNFLRHHGLSPRAIARAALSNLKAGSVVQGGSTLTQQLVKNFYLSHERSLSRKAREAIMSLLLELHYSKREILETYINEVYLGQSGQRAIHGFALASQHYFNRPLGELRKSQIALLVGLVKGASYYNPWRHPERAIERRNLVLKIMRDSNLLNAAEYHRAQSEALGLARAGERSRHDYPAFIELVRRQLARDYREEDLRSEGIRIFTGFNLRAQRRLERSVVAQLTSLERDKNIGAQSLQAASVVVAVGSGEVQALVGDRQVGYHGFNRALDAQRSIGSLIKPAIYLTALERGYTLVSPIDDSPVKVKGPDGIWQPRNFDRRDHGTVPLYRALANSYNQAAARLGMQLGLARVADSVQRLGVDKPVPQMPAMLLGAVELSPLQVATMYHTIAADGFYTPLKAIRDVQDAEGKPLNRYPLEVQQRFDPADVYQLKYALKQVMRTGSGRSAYRQLPSNVDVAGKTGTSNDQRDSWFAGFSADTLAVVWVGRDDNGVTPLTGGSGALKIWSDFMRFDPGRSLDAIAPPGVKDYWVDADSGLASAANCRGAIRLPFRQGKQPQQKVGCDWVENPLLYWWKTL